MRISPSWANGIIGQKNHIQVGKLLEEQIDAIIGHHKFVGRQLQALWEVIDKDIIINYKLWPTNYIAHDLLHQNEEYKGFYTQEEKAAFGP